MIGEERSGELVRYDTHDGEFVPYLDGLEARWVTFSSDRRWVAYSRYSDGTLWAMHADASVKRQLTFAPMYTDGIAWSPDGRCIAVRAQAKPGAPFKISACRADRRRSERGCADQNSGVAAR